VTLRLASAPCTWGVWERTVDRDDLIPPDLMLGTVQELGYTGIELGPPGYLGESPDAVLAKLGPYGLQLVGAHGPLVLAADENETRLHVAGRPDARAATSLNGEQMKAAAGRVERAAERARGAGVTTAFHPHTATYIEGPEEVAAFLEATDPDLVKITFDTGHCIVGGGDPVAFVRQFGDRIAHLHLKDVDPHVLDRVRSQELTVEEAWERGLFCEFGTGAVDFAAVLAALPAYDGWAVVEQDRVAVQVDALPAVRAVEERNIAALG
jgi:inosose dehydratase